MSIPIPPLAIQREIVAELEAERALVEANRNLVEIFEKKIQAKLAEIWGGEKDDLTTARQNIAPLSLFVNQFF